MLIERDTCPVPIVVFIERLVAAGSEDRVAVNADCSVVGYAPLAGGGAVAL